MMQHNHDCAREPVQYLDVHVFVPTDPNVDVHENIHENVHNPVPTGFAAVHEPRYVFRGQRRALLGLAVVVPVGILIFYQPVIGLVMLVSAGLYLANEHIDRVMTDAGSDS